MSAVMGKVGRKYPSSESYGERNMDVRAQGASIVQVETLGKNGIVLLWINCVITAIAVCGMFVAYDAYRHLRGHVNVLQYDLQDLRAKTGHAHATEE